ncbi:MAG: DUF167 domain-containing protein [Deltaproteobacteria bacterium]|nr:DUF167 domain-containing protein [Deltaproteobacteria bacterium]
MKASKPASPITSAAASGKFQFLRQTPKGLFIHVRVQPRASKNSVDDVAGDALKLRITSPPVEGEANRAVIELLSRLLSIKKTAFSIDAGTKSRDKRVRVEGFTLKELEHGFLSLRKG